MRFAMISDAPRPRAIHPVQHGGLLYSRRAQGNAVYDIDWPDGVYCLDLASPLHRAVVMELCDLEQLQRPPRGCSAIRLDGKLKGKGQCLTDLGYPGEAMPSRGTLECTYTSPLLPASPTGSARGVNILLTGSYIPL